MVCLPKKSTVTHNTAKVDKINVMMSDNKHLQAFMLTYRIKNLTSLAGCGMKTKGLTFKTKMFIYQSNTNLDVKSLFGKIIPFKGPCGTLVLCGRAVLSKRVNKPYMNCKQHENIGKAMAANYYGSSIQRDLEGHFFSSR